MTFVPIILLLILEILFAFLVVLIGISITWYVLVRIYHKAKNDVLEKEKKKSDAL